MKDVMARVYFIYGMLLFSITMIPVAIIFFIVRNFANEKTANRIIQKTFQRWMGFYMPMIFCKVTHVGREHFKPGKQYIVTINHNSLADVPVSSPGIPGPNRTLAKIEMAKIPIFGYIYTSGSILVSRTDAQSRRDSMQHMKNALQKGLHLCLFPEGTRNKTDLPLAKFYDGAFRLAIETQTPIIPAIIFGTKNILHPTKKMWAWPHKIQFHFLPEVSVEPYTVKETEKKKNRVSDIMRNHYTNNYRLSE